MQEWLVGIVGADLARIVSIALTALFVILLAVIALAVLRRLMGGGMGLRSSAGPRVEVVDVTALDQKRKLVLIRRDQVEHLILIGGQNDLVVEAQIGRAPAPGRRVEPAQPAMPPRRPAPPPQVPAAAHPQAPRRVDPGETMRESPPVTIDVPADAGRAPARQNARSEPSFATPAVDAPRTEDRLFEAPRDEGPPAPRVELDRPHVEEAPEPRNSPRPPQPVSPPARAVVDPAPRPVAEPIVASAPRPNPAPLPLPPRAPMATPTLPLKRTNPVAPETVSGSPAAEGERDLSPWPKAPDADVRPAVGPSSPIFPKAPVRKDPDLVERPQEAPVVRSDRQPLNVRSFASTIQQRPTTPPPPPAPPSAAASPFVDSPPASRPAALEDARPVPTAPIVPAAPAVIVPSTPTEPSPPDNDDDLARALSAEFASDETIDFSADDTRGPAPLQTGPEAAERSDPRELSLEEEMERLLRDFSQQTADRR